MFRVVKRKTIQKEFGTASKTEILRSNTLLGIPTDVWWKDVIAPSGREAK